MKNLRLIIILALAFLLIIGLGYFLIAKKKIFPQAQGGPSLGLVPSSGTFAGETFNVAITLDTVSQIADRVEAVISYNNQLFEVEDAEPDTAGTQITSGSLFDRVLTNEVSEGKISYSAGSQGSPFNGQGTLATVSFKGLQSGTAGVVFDFTPGSTSDSNIIEQGTGGDILESVTNGSYQIVIAIPSPSPTPTPTTKPPGTRRSPTPSPTATPTAQPTPEQTQTQEQVITLPEEPSPASQPIAQTTSTPTQPTYKATPNPSLDKIFVAKLDLPIAPEGNVGSQTKTGGFAILPKFGWLFYLFVPVLLTGGAVFLYFRRKKRPPSPKEEIQL